MVIGKHYKSEISLLPCSPAPLLPESHLLSIHQHTTGTELPVVDYFNIFLFVSLEGIIKLQHFFFFFYFLVEKP